MYKILRAGVVAALLTALGLVVTAAPALADDCGATAAQWSAPIVGSAWSGTLTDSGGAESVVLVLTNVSSAAAMTVGVVPVAGNWSVSANFPDQLLASLATEGISYFLEVSASTCSGGKVTAASGAATDGEFNVDPVSLTRTL